jgi:hypothetical protein
MDPTHRQTFDVVHDAVATAVCAILPPAFLFSRLALVAARLGAFPLVERNSARGTCARVASGGCGYGRHHHGRTDV